MNGQISSKVAGRWRVPAFRSSGRRRRVETVAVHILEDDPGVCDSLKLLLQQLGHRVNTYPDAETFFETPPPGPEDVVIVDLGLPGISGAHVIDWIAALKQAPRVIAISGQTQHQIDKQLAGVTHAPILLRKPLTEAKLAELL